jgi:hypothetical protein
MIEENGMPKLAASATTLGIRRGKDIVPDQNNMVHRPLFQPGQKNGLSCARTILFLPPFALPIEWGGSNAKTVVWRIEESELPAELIAQDDSIPGVNQHISIGPRFTMGYDDFAKIVEATRPKWKKVKRTP